MFQLERTPHDKMERQTEVMFEHRAEPGRKKNPKKARLRDTDKLLSETQVNMKPEKNKSQNNREPSRQQVSQSNREKCLNSRKLRQLLQANANCIVHIYIYIYEHTYIHACTEKTARKHYGREKVLYEDTKRWIIAI